MSTANCRRCNGLISFVLADNDRWRPVEAQYLALETEEDEVIAIMADGVMRAQKASMVRVYRYHRCPEDPALRRGQARTRVVGPEVDERTGEVLAGDDSWAAGEELQRQAREHERTYPTREPYTCDTCGVVDDHDEDECPEDDEAFARQQQEKRHYDYCKKGIPATQVGVACPVCHTIAGEPCWDVHGRPRRTTHDQRGWVTAFGDDEPWPPDPKQRGYPVMKRWLRENADLFATPRSTP